MSRQSYSPRKNSHEFDLLNAYGRATGIRYGFIRRVFQIEGETAYAVTCKLYIEEGNDGTRTVVHSTFVPCIRTENKFEANRIAAAKLIEECGLDEVKALIDSDKSRSGTKKKKIFTKKRSTSSSKSWADQSEEDGDEEDGDEENSAVEDDEE